MSSSQDCHQQYYHIQLLKHGLSSPTILAVYSLGLGGYVGSLHLLSLTNATDISFVLQLYQPITESLKASMPEYHIHAMRNAMFDKFGLVTRNVKKSISHPF